MLRGETRRGGAPTGEPYDFIVVGSGFGGSVSALRLAEKGYRVLVLEAGKRFAAGDFARTSWNLRRYLWLPALGCYGIQRITLLRDVLVLSGTGVGGGSLVYANTLLAPHDEVFAGGAWPRGTDWKLCLAPHYAAARRILGVTPTPRIWAGDEALAAFAAATGRAGSFARTEVAVLFGEQPGEEVGDPFFGGEGPLRSTCTACGGCMVGCRFEAKNTLDKNYLYFAERLGAEVAAETTATLIKPDGEGGYLVHTRRTTGLPPHRRRTLRARGVVLAAGAMGTTDLLLRCREAGTLPGLSPTLGRRVRTNSEVLCGATARDDHVDYSEGIAIASSLYTSANTHIEVVRYSRGSDFMSLLATVQVGPGTRLTRPLRWLVSCARHPLDLLRSLNPFGWARRSVILLVMQTIENSIRLVRKRHWYWPFGRRLGSRRDPGLAPVPSYIADGNEAARAVARTIGGFPSTAINEALLDIPMTAHILGGACMGTGAEEGVVDEVNRVFGHPGLWVVDGASVPANLGVNPSLTITAIAEHAMSAIPPKDPAAGLRPLPPQARAAPES